ncbi:hypothetical protein AVEN_44955-1 [Araneus ventricosus]|uniref:Uncharacterized protein n=1 Tax=Araneus ventricosus TaxID=182803 RepID=A0A4Y2V2D0_ARAVE|nr:hypothetical protein AVEN_44955-1 [Araneus ventricosus]
MSDAKDSYRTEMVLKRKEKCVYTQPSTSNEKLLSKEAARKLSTKLQRNVHLKKMNKISLKSRVPSSNKHLINENVTEKSVKKRKTSEPSAKRRKCPLTIKEMFVNSLLRYELKY